MANNSNATLQGNITAAELWIHLSIFYAFLCGIVTTLGNILIIIGIVRSKKLRNRFFVTVGLLTFCRVLLCLQFLIIAIYRMLRQGGLAPSEMDRLSCHSIHFWLLIGFTVEMILLLTLVLDRALAIVAASMYRRLTMRQAFAVCITVFLVGIVIKLPVSYVNVHLREVVTCTNSYSAPSEIFNLYTQNIDLALLALILVVYIALILYVQIRVRALRSTTNSQAAMIALKRQIKLMPMLRNLVLAHCSFVMISKILRTLAGVYDDHSEASARFTAYGGVFSTLDLFSNMIALLWSNNDIRMASLPWCRCLHKKPAAGTQMDVIANDQAPNTAANGRKTSNSRVGPAPGWTTDRAE